MTDGAPAARALEGARQLAGEHGHDFVGTEHLLAALLADRNGFAATVMAAAGLEPPAVSAALLRGLRAAPPDREGDPPVSRFAERALAAAAADAGRNGRSEAEEQDLVRQLVGQARGRMAQALRGDGTALAAMQAALGTGRGTKPTGAAPVEAEPDAEAAPRRAKGRRGEDGGRRDARPDEEGDRKRGRAPKPEKAPREPLPKPKLPPRSPDPGPVDEAEEARPRRIAMPHPPRRFPWSRLLLLAIPAAFYLQAVDAAPGLIFLTACLGVLPLAGLMGEATEVLAERTGPTIGGLLNATFGNAAELIIALAALRAGLVDLVKASITGSILGNLLLILGLSFIAGGLHKPIVKFNQTSAGMSAAMLALAVVGLVFPALFHALPGPVHPTAELYLSEAVAVILAVTYGLSLLFSLKTHRALFGGGEHPGIEPKWSIGWAIGLLAASTVGIVAMSEVLVHNVEAVTASLGVSQMFLGLVVIPLVGNAAEHATAILVARKGQMDLALQIALGSSTQVALLVAPILVLAGVLMAVPMNLVFPVFDVAALGVATIVISIITLDGETHWFEGVQLLAVYALFAAAVYFI